MAFFSRNPREHWLKTHFSKNEVANSGYSKFQPIPRTCLTKFFRFISAPSPESISVENRSDLISTKPYPKEFLAYNYRRASCGGHSFLYDVKAETLYADWSSN